MAVGELLADMFYVACHRRIGRRGIRGPKEFVLHGNIIMIYLGFVQCDNGSSASCRLFGKLTYLEAFLGAYLGTSLGTSLGGSE